VVGRGMEALDPKSPGVWLTGWAPLGDMLLQSVAHRLGVSRGPSWGRWDLPVDGLSRWREVALSFAALGFSLLGLLALMGLAGGRGI